MRTPNLRRRTVRAGVLAVAALLLLFSVSVYTVLHASLDDALDELLDTRTQLAVDLASELPDDEAAARLRSLGVPATITAPDGRTTAATPVTLRSGPVPPVAAGLVPPITSRTTELADGTTVVVFATRAGVERTLVRLGLALTAGVVLGVWAAHVLLRRLVDATLGPLDRVASTAERISAGELHQRLRPDDPETDLGRMAVSFDRMVDSLEAAVAAEAEEKERQHRFLADAAHQLRTPITGIRGSVELLLRTEDRDTREQLLANAVRETHRASTVVTSLLRIARLDRGQPPERARIDLEPLVTAEVERARELSPSLAIHARTTPAVVDADGRDVAEALGNLIDNARRHAREQVEVELTVTTAEVAVRVSDDGDGVTPGTEGLVFERFATLDGRGGSGLGLPIARGVARVHGGDVTLEDGGFVLRLPLATDGND